MANVRTTLVTLEELDDALAAKFSGIQVPTFSGGMVDVPVYLGEEFPPDARSYPRITIEISMIGDDYEDYEGDIDVYAESFDDTVDPPERIMKAMPEDVQIFYRIKAWVKNDTQMMRSLVQKMRAKLPRRSYLSIPKVDQDDTDRSVWMIQEGDTLLLKDPNPDPWPRTGVAGTDDELILQTVWTYGILAELELETPVPAGATEAAGGGIVEKTVKTLEFGLWKGVDKDKKWRSFEYDADTFTPKP